MICEKRKALIKDIESTNDFKIQIWDSKCETIRGGDLTSFVLLITCSI